jgi:hypothetical protein
MWSRKTKMSMSIVKKKIKKNVKKKLCFNKFCNKKFRTIILSVK